MRVFCVLIAYMRSTERGDIAWVLPNMLSFCRIEAELRFHSSQLSFCEARGEREGESLRAHATRAKRSAARSAAQAKRGAKATRVGPPFARRWCSSCSFARPARLSLNLKSYGVMLDWRGEGGLPAARHPKGWRSTRAVERTCVGLRPTSVVPSVFLSPKQGRPETLGRSERVRASPSLYARVRAVARLCDGHQTKKGVC